jgi:hypothetical protein
MVGKLCVLDAFIYQPLISLAICCLCSLLFFFHGSYYTYSISLLSTFTSSSRNEPPFSPLSSFQHLPLLLSFMASRTHNYSSLVLKTPPSHYDHLATHQFFATPTPAHRHRSFVLISPNHLSHLSLILFSSPSSRSPSSTTAPPNLTNSSSSSLGRVARFVTLCNQLSLGTEASNAPS